MSRNGERLMQSALDSNYGTSSLSVAKVGQMNPEQANQFIDFVFDQTALKNGATVYKMNYSQRRIPKIDVGQKVLWPGTSGADINSGLYTKATPTEVNLNTKLMKAVAQIYDEELEDNVEGDGFRDHFMRMMATRIGNQLESAFLTGYNTGGSPAAVDINQLFTGWLTSANSAGHVIDLSPVNTLWTDRFVNTAKLSKLIKSIPTKYRAARTGLRYFVPPDIYQDYIDIVGARQTIGGDIAFRAPGYEENIPVGPSVLGYGAIPIYPVPLYPETQFVAATTTPYAGTTGNGSTLAAGATTSVVSATNFANIAIGDWVSIDVNGVGTVQEQVLISGVNSGTHAITFTSTPTQYSHADGVAAVRGTADGTSILLTHQSNLLIGIQRDIRLEFERRDAREGAWYAVFTLRADCQMLNPDATALGKNLGVR